MCATRTGTFSAKPTSNTNMYTHPSVLYIELALKYQDPFATLWSKCVSILMIKITGSIIILEVLVFITKIQPQKTYNCGDSCWGLLARHLVASLAWWKAVPLNNLTSQAMLWCTLRIQSKKATEVLYNLQSERGLCLFSQSGKSWKFYSCKESCGYKQSISPVFTLTGERATADFFFSPKTQNDILKEKPPLVP